jgi:hypothetical protein
MQIAKCKLLNEISSLHFAICILVGAVGVSVAALSPDILRPSGAIPAHIAGLFREAAGFQQSASGRFYVFDRRAHAVYGVDAAQTRSWEIVKIGAESGRIIDPTAFSVARDGSFVVADAPNGRERIQLFSADGVRTGGFQLPGRMRPRVTIDSQVLNGIGSLQYTGTSILMSQPETGALVAEFSSSGGITRTFGRLRPTGHEDDRELHLALNSGLALVDPTGGFFFVFQTGEPTFRKYDANGQLLFERRVEGREIDPVRAALPTTWGTRHTSDGDMPLVSPTVRTAAVDAAGRLWISFVVPFTYVYDGDGDKLRTLQFRGSGIVSPASLFFGPKGQLLVTPGLLEFQNAR